MNKEDKIYVAGHRGLAGGAIYRRLAENGFTNVVGRTHKELDLTRQKDVENFFQEQKPAYVFLAAAKVGGILANNTFPADFIYQNLVIQTHVIHAAWQVGVRRLLFLGSSCIYPRECPQPMKEEYLLSGPLEATNEPYAVAKIAGIKQCQSYNRQYGTRFLTVMPTNLFGPGDNFDLQTSHVFPALIRKFHEAKLGKKTVTVWGTGTPRREFLFSEDLADACIFLMNMADTQFDGFVHRAAAPLINIGFGKDITIKELALRIGKVIGYKGDIHFDTTKPDGTPQKLLDLSCMRQVGWSPRVSLDDGIRKTYDWCLTNGIFNTEMGDAPKAL